MGIAAETVGIASGAGRTGHAGIARPHGTAAMAPLGAAAAHSLLSTVCAGVATDHGGSGNVPLATAPAAVEAGSVRDGSGGATVQLFNRSTAQPSRRLLPGLPGAATLRASMDRNEYERRRRAIEEIYRNDLELVRAAHEARIRSLEALWTSFAPVPGAETTAPPAPSPAPSNAPAPATPLQPRPPDLRQAIEEVFPQLPDRFEKKDVVAALGWTPSRSGLYRVLLDLAIEGRLHITPSGGRHPSQYRKL